MNIKPTRLPEVVLIQLQMFEDNRGFSMETYREYEFKKAGIYLPLVQDNHSRSKQGVLRGMHYQVKHTQGKLVRVVFGDVFDVSVDLRRSSPSFRQWVGVHLSSEYNQQLWVPPGFAHGFYVLSNSAEIIYKVTDYWAPEWERTLRWNDPDIAVDWPLLNGDQPILSTKDSQGKFFGELVESDLFP